MPGITFAISCAIFFVRYRIKTLASGFCFGTMRAFESRWRSLSSPLTLMSGLRVSLCLCVNFFRFSNKTENRFARKSGECESQFAFDSHPVKSINRSAASHSTEKKGERHKSTWVSRSTVAACRTVSPKLEPNWSFLGVTAKKQFTIKGQRANNRSAVQLNN